MTLPTGTDVHVSAPLTSISIAYAQDAKNFVHDKVFPPLPVDKQFNKFFKYDKAYWLKSSAQLRAPGSESAGAGFTLSTGTYNCDVYAEHVDIADQIAKNADDPLNLERDSAMLATAHMLIKREEVFATNYLGASIWGNTDQTGVASSPSTNQFVQWDQASGAYPLRDVEQAKIRILKSTGFMPNVLVVGAAVHAALLQNPDIVDRFKYTQNGILTEDLLARAFGVDKYLVCRAVKNTAKEGATASMDFIAGGKGALLVYSAPSPSIMQPSGGYTFTWKGLLGDGSELANAGMATSSFRMDHLKSTRVEVESAFDFNLVASDLGQWFASAVA